MVIGAQCIVSELPPRRRELLVLLDSLTRRCIVRGLGLHQIQRRNRIQVSIYWIEEKRARSHLDTTVELWRFVERWIGAKV